MVQQKQQFKAISLELLVDIFKAVSGYPNIFMKEFEKINDSMNTSKQRFVLKIRFTENLLISSSIVNIFCKEVLQKRKTIIIFKQKEMADKINELEQNLKEIRQAKVQAQQKVAQLNEQEQHLEDQLKEEKKLRQLNPNDGLGLLPVGWEKIFNSSNGLTSFINHNDSTTTCYDPRLSQTSAVDLRDLNFVKQQNYLINQQQSSCRSYGQVVDMVRSGPVLSQTIQGSDAPCRSSQDQSVLHYQSSSSIQQSIGGGKMRPTIKDLKNSGNKDEEFRCDLPGCTMICKTGRGLEIHKAKHVKDGKMDF